MNNQTYSKTQTFNKHKQYQTISQHSLFGLQETSSFLKKEITEIIKGELKAYHLRNQLQSQLEQYKKQQQNEKLTKKTLEDRINNFRDKEKRYRNKQFELFQSRQKERQQKLKMFTAQKQNAHHIKCIQMNRTLNNVRQRYNNITNEDMNIRLSKLAHTSQGKRIKNSSTHSQCRILSLSQNSSRAVVVKQIEAEEEKHKITNYLNKIERSQSKILLKEIQNQKRRQTSLKKKVQCFISQRKKLEEDKIEKVEKQYTKRMDTFASNYSRIVQNKELALMSKTTVNARMRKQVSAKRLQIHKEQIEKIVFNYNNGRKNNLLQQYRSVLDLNYTKNNRSLNLRKKKIQQNSAQLQNRIRLLAQKIDIVKNIRYGQKLDSTTANGLLSLIDKNDPEYFNIADFLRSERGAFVEGIVRKEEEQRAKLKKISKGVNKNNGL